jgi:spore coat protein A, manganese oxidase
MRLTRRDFIKASAAGGAGLMVLGRAQRAWAFYQSPTTIPLFGTTLRGVGPGGIPVAAADALPAPVTGVTHYTIGINQFTDDIGGGGTTTLWGYHPVNPLGGGGQPQKHLGGIIVGTRNAPIQITFRNNLGGVNGGNHIIPNDLTIKGANQAYNRTATHMHGGLVPWISDGGPFDWWDPDGSHGGSFLNNAVLNPTAAGNEAEYYYPLNQSARFMWYHDHAYGITRINAYAGIATALIIRDGFEIGLKGRGLPEFIENSVVTNTTVRELPLVIQDKIFVGANIGSVDPTWSGPYGEGSLWYAHVYDTTRYGPLGPAPSGLPSDPSVVPEFFGDTMLVNGTTYPTVTVDPGRYRFRILNACNARFLNLQLYVDDGTPNGITLDPKTGNPLNKTAKNAAAPNPQGKATPNFLVLGTEGGFLPTPTLVPCSTPFNPAAMGGSLLLAPAERSDLLFDFSAHAGQSLILYTDTPAPFPGGDPRNDYFPGWNVKANLVNALTTPGNGPNTRVLMRIQVSATGPGDTIPLSITPATNLSAGNDTLLVPLGVTALPPGVKVVPLTLNEGFDEHGRLAQFLGTNIGQPGGGFGQPYDNAPTETAVDNEIQVWQIANLTADTHPIHFHLVNVQIISRQPFSVKSYKGTPALNGAPVPPAPEERGWKETVRMNPGEVTTVIMQFKLPQIVGPTGAPIDTTASPASNQLPITGGMPPASPRTGGNEYVWHCHILEHEEHDMMRPLIVG